MTNRNSTTALSLATILGLALAAPLPAHAQDQQNQTATRVQVSEKEPFGQFLVDGENISLYLLEADVRGSDDEKAVSTCYDECAEEWPPFITSGELEAGEQVAEPLLSTIERTDGAMQVTYNGWPLYYYHDDQAPGDTTGHDVHDDWGGWYLVTPSGEPVGEESEGN